MPNDEIIQIFKAIIPKIRGDLGREPFFQIFYDLQKNNPAMLQKIKNNAEDLIVFAMATRSGMYTELGITEKNDRINLDYIIFNLNETKLLEMIKRDKNNAILSLNSIFEKNGISYRVDGSKIDTFSETVPRMKKIGQVARILRMIELGEEIFACAGYVPRYLTMTTGSVISEGNLLSEGISDVKLSLVNMQQAQKLCEDMLAITGHNRDSVRDKNIGLSLEIASRQYIASLAVSGLRQNRGDKAVLSKEDCINMIAYIIISLKDYQNSD